MKIGLTGLPQSGKTELQGVFESLGARFVNLNEVGYAMRRLGSPDRAEYDTLVPGCLHDDGRQRPQYYLRLGEEAVLIERILAMEEPRIVVAANGEDSTGLVILSWEYHFRNLGKIDMSHLFILQCRDERVWFNRLRARARSRGWSGPDLQDSQLRSLMEAALYRWESFEEAARVCPFPHTIIETSADDWGESELRATFRRLGW